MSNSHRRRAFTLIEILVVLALLGIMVGIVLLVIDVPAQRKRARQAVSRENIAKVCSAYTGCLISFPSPVVDECATWLQIGAVEPLSPEGAQYTLNELGPSVSVDGCLISCNNQGIITLINETGGGCLVH